MFRFTSSTMAMNGTGMPRRTARERSCMGQAQANQMPDGVSSTCQRAGACDPPDRDIFAAVCALHWGDPDDSETVSGHIDKSFRKGNTTGPACVASRLVHSVRHASRRTPSDGE